MDKNAIKKYAVWARRELIARVAGQAARYGVTEDGWGNADADNVEGRVLSDTEKKQRIAFIDKVRSEGYEQAIEEVAYTWFNRFCALRYMEVNGYFQSHVRIFTNDADEFKPQILDEALHLDLDGLNMEKVLKLKEDANQTEELFRYLLITQCNALSSILPGMFQKIEDYTELLLPDNLLREGSVIDRLIAEIPEEDWTDQVQIIGWLYQYYNAEKKDEVFAALKKKKTKITKENIPAATQLFTPDWIVRYMVENSLGRLWLEGHSNEELKASWKYYLDEAELEPEVEAQLSKTRKEYSNLKPEEILCIDPCAGSGHIICYLFDILLQIYESYGFTTREAVSSIVENNLYGLDIDERAAQLAYFSVMMKARSYDRRFFSRGIQPHVYAIRESNNIDYSLVDYFVGSDLKLKKDFGILMNELYDAKEYGSILNITPLDFDAMYERVEKVKTDISFHVQPVMDMVLPLIRVGQVLAQKYDVVVTNPPYMGSSNMGPKLSEFVKKNYPDSKSDQFSCFIERCFQFAKDKAFVSMITMESWMFLSSFEKMRQKIVDHKNVVNMVHMPYLGKGGTSLGINFGTAAVIFENCKVPNYQAQYDCIRYYETDDDGIPFEFPVVNERYKTASLDNFSKISGSPVAYWASDAVFKDFSRGTCISKIAFPASGTSTGDNDKFLRLWHEVDIGEVNFEAQNGTIADKKWFPCNKGGAYRRWAGGNEYLIDWENDGQRIKNCPKAYLRNVSSIFLPGLTWSKLGSGAFSIRYFPEGFICESIGCCLFYKKVDLRLILALLNTKVASMLLLIINPSMGRQPGYIGSIPFIMEKSKKATIYRITGENIELSKSDWDAFEISWDFIRHPLIKSVSFISEAFNIWSNECEVRFSKLKANEEELNHIFIDIYGLQDELTAEEDEKEVSVRRAELNRDIKSLISYAVGCMFGRYSLDVDGLAYAGGEWDPSKYITYQPDYNGILPICDDEYFTDDIVGHFVDFIRTVYGEATLEENLQFIADALGGSSSAREVIRKYFLNDFYKDHCKIYQKRPIYWMFDSGKKNGFKCLIYLHRYRPDTIARIRTDYVHEQQARYRTAIAELENRISSASTSESIKLNKILTKMQDQVDELIDFEEKIHHLADQYIDINLDDGVKVNYAKFQDVLAKIK